MTQTRTQQIAAAAAHYRAHEGEGVRGWEEAAFEAGAHWADENPLPQPPRCLPRLISLNPPTDHVHRLHRMLLVYLREKTMHRATLAPFRQQCG